MLKLARKNQQKNITESLIKSQEFLMPAKLTVSEVIHIIRLADPAEGGSESVKPADGAEIAPKGFTSG